MSPRYAVFLHTSSRATRWSARQAWRYFWSTDAEELASSPAEAKRWVAGEQHQRLSDQCDYDLAKEIGISTTTILQIRILALRKVFFPEADAPVHEAVMLPISLYLKKGQNVVAGISEPLHDASATAFTRYLRFLLLGYCRGCPSTITLEGREACSSRSVNIMTPVFSYGG